MTSLMICACSCTILDYVTKSLLGTNSKLCLEPTVFKLPLHVVYVDTHQLLTSVHLSIETMH